MTLAIRDLLTVTGRVIAARRRLFVILVAIDAVPQIALEFAPGDWTRLGAALGLVTLYLQLLATFAALAELGLAPPGYEARRPTEGRYPSAFLLGLLTVPAILIGLALLIVPGVVLLALWSVALPALAAEQLSVTDAMRRSWRLVRPRLGRVVMLNLLWLAPFGLLVAAVGLVFWTLPEAAVAWAMAVFDAALSTLLIAGAIVWAAVYAALRHERGGSIMTAPRWVSLWYRGAAIYGLVVLLPQYLTAPPPGGEVNFYGFVGIAIAFQLAFWVIGGDPLRYRALMPVTVIEKLVFGVPVALLYAAGKAPALVFGAGLIDLALGLGFLLAWRATPRA